MTAEEFFKQERLVYNTEGITANPSPDYNALFYREIFDLMNNYAKYHVELALKAASENVDLTEQSWLEMCEGLGEVVFDKDSILNSYPLTKIK